MRTVLALSLALPFSLAVLSPAPVWAQLSAPMSAPEDDDPSQADPAQGDEGPEIDWSQIRIDPLSLMRDIPQPGQPQRPVGRTDAENWNHSENKNGSSNVALKRAWSNGISTSAGVDSVGAKPAWTLPGDAPPPGSGSGWASAAIPGAGVLIDRTTVDARVDPESDQRKFGARFEKSVPILPQLSVTLQNGYGVSQPFAPQNQVGAPSPAQVIDSEQLAKLNVLNYGTSLFAGSKLSSADEKRLNSFGAEQKFLDGLSVSGAVNENAAGGHDRSLTARFRRTW